MNARTAISRILALIACLGSGVAVAQPGVTYTNYIRQVQLPSGVVWDASVAPAGEQPSVLPINPGGARFELWTVQSNPLTGFLLDTRYVSAFVPEVSLRILTEDPHPGISRTRADRPFTVEITVAGLVFSADAPESARAATLLRHVQAYPADSSGEGVDRNQAQLHSQSLLTQNGNVTLPYAINAVPGGDRAKVRGEERFSVFSLADAFGPAAQLASQTLQIWPVADGRIEGLPSGTVVRSLVPEITLVLNDLYPESRTFLQAYPGPPQLGKTGTVLPGSSLILNESTPQSRVLRVQQYDAALDSDGEWTIELLTETPFGIDRLASTTLTLDRTIRINTNLNTLE
jgi:hypothetical protein